jgi:hypothetical protein
MRRIDMVRDRKVALKLCDVAVYLITSFERGLVCDLQIFMYSRCTEIGIPMETCMLSFLVCSSGLP